MKKEKPISNEEISAHWQEVSPIREQLRAVLDPLAAEVSGYVLDEFSECSPDTMQELIQGVGNAYVLPYHDIDMLSPALFGSINKKTIKAYGSLGVPFTKWGRNKVTDRYFAWAETIKEKDPNAEFPSRETVMKGLKLKWGSYYTREGWLRSAQLLQRVLRDESSFKLEAHWYHRIINDPPKYEDFSKEDVGDHIPYSSYVLVMSQVLQKGKDMSGVRDYAEIPIGQYGIKGAEKLARSTVLLNDFIKSSEVVDATVKQAMNEETSKLFAEHTARVRGLNNSKGNYAAGTKLILHEGILSIAQTLAMLSSKKVEGYESQEELVGAILETTLVEQVARLTWPGYIGPSTLGGVHLREPLVLRNGNLALGDELTSFFRENRIAHIKRSVGRWAAYKQNGQDSSAPNLGLVCPAASPNGAIASMKQTIGLLMAS